MLLPFLAAPPDGEAIRVGDQTIGYPQLRAAALALAARLAGSERVAVWAAPGVETCVGVVASLAAGTALVPLNPASGPRGRRAPARARGARARAPGPRRSGGRSAPGAGSGGARARPLHLGHDGASEGRRHPATGRRLEPGRPRGGLGVDGGRPARARAAALPRPRTRPRHPRPAPPRRASPP